ncbi:hypothetical protein ACH5RR_014663 [Cinchona calisaya]|uniref:Premnaspirodiene oxygenase-like n=1 Tax=Cinchona calisaya TaxID=153742 RepID=A0ABD2ZQY3_9GENT
MPIVSFQIMEITLPLSFISFIAFLLVLRLIYKLNSMKKHAKTPKLPPGPWKLPIIGSVHHLALLGSLPHRALRDLARKHGQITHLQLGEISAVVVSGARMAKEVLKFHDIALADRPKLLAAEIITYNYQDIGFSPFGVYWRQMRKICNSELLGVKNVRAFCSIREDEVWNMIGSIQLLSSAMSPVNLTEKVFAYTNAITCRAAFGARCKYQDELIPLIKETIEASGGFEIADLFPSKKFLHIISGTIFKLARLHSKLDRILDNIIQEHIENPATTDYTNVQSREEDLVDVLLKIKERGGLDFPISKNSIKAIIVIRKHSILPALPLSVMEITYPLILVTFASLLLLLKLARQSIEKSKGNVSPKFPPGPWKLPLIGSMHHLAGSLPHHALRILAQKYGPVIHLQLGEISTFIISAPEAAKEVLKIHDIAFAYRPELLASKILGYDNLDIAFSPYGDYWKQMRKICLLELLSPKNVRSFGSIREDEAWKLIRSIESASNLPINVTEKIFAFTNGVVCRAAFGKSCKDQDLLISLINEAILAGGGFDIADLFPSLKFLHSLSGLKPKLLKLHKMIDQILDNIINEHKHTSESSNGDLVDVLLRLKERGDFEIPISTKSIKAVIWAMTYILRYRIFFDA